MQPPFTDAPKVKQHVRAKLHKMAQRPSQTLTVSLPISLISKSGKIGSKRSRFSLVNPILETQRSKGLATVTLFCCFFEILLVTRISYLLKEKKKIP